MMLAVMYGMMPSAKIEKLLERAAGEQVRGSRARPAGSRRLRAAARWRSGRCRARGWRRRGDRAAIIAIDEQDLVPQVVDLEDVLQVREHGEAPSSRSSLSGDGELIGGQRLANWLPLTAGRPAFLLPEGQFDQGDRTACGRDRCFSGRRRCACDVQVDLGRDLAAGEHLDERRSCGRHRWRRAPRGSTVDSPVCSTRSPSVCEVDRLVLDAERVVEPLQLRDALLERHLAAFEAAGNRAAARAGPWCRDRRSCRPCRRYRDRRASWRSSWRLVTARGRGPAWSALFRRGRVRDTSIRCGTRAIMPRISGRSGRVFGRRSCRDRARAACRGAWAWCRSTT